MRIVSVPQNSGGPGLHAVPRGIESLCCRQSPLLYKEVTSVIATYRLQLVPELSFAEVEKLVPYFQRLGISHLYLSPITEARAGSTHGYDVIHHNAIREEFGGREGFDRLLSVVREAGLELVLDFVPNHAGVGPHNEAWQHVLAHGQHSPFARYFDIDWNPLEETLQGRVLLPFLGEPYGQALDTGAIGVVWEAGLFYASYFENRFALAPNTYADLLAVAMPHHERTDLYFDLKELQEAYATLSPSEVHKAEMLERRLQAVADKVDWETVLEEISGERLHELLEKQNWRLAYWKAASYEINYRRFFDINGLVALRMEDDEVFWSAHRLLGELVTQEGIAGVRIDHIDGLFDPQAYLERLQQLGTKHIWVEKILAPGETMPDGWPVDGTTGYEFMNDVMSVLLDSEGMPAVERTYGRFVPDGSSFADIARESKLLVMETALSSELYRLSYELNRLCKADYHTRDFALGALREALSEIVAALDRYRTYLPYDQETAREVIEKVAHRARQRTPAFEPSLYDFIAHIILGEVPEHLVEHQQAWVGRFQQYTAPVAAKGVEDTTFYRYLPLVALNEVGGEPEVGEQPVQAFHSHARFRAQRYPRNLLATATHDHKRGEDTRMRLITLTEVPDQWEETLRNLSLVGEPHRGMHGPSRYDQYLFYQVLVALWEGSDHDALSDRLWEYMQKASRESKRQTSWNNPNESYEKELEQFVRSVLADTRLPEAIEPLAHAVAERGYYNSLSQVVLKFTVPGVPDFYQGCELFDLSLVDPDNRQPVDYQRRSRLLDEMQGLIDRPVVDPIRGMIESRDETAKFYLTARLLRVRREHDELFDKGTYRDLELQGPDTKHWLGFAREHEGSALIAIVPRLPASWADQHDARLLLDEALAEREWTEVLTGTAVRACSDIDLNALPIPWAVLYSRSDHSHD